MGDTKAHNKLSAFLEVKTVWIHSLDRYFGNISPSHTWEFVSNLGVYAGMMSCKSFVKKPYSVSVHAIDTTTFHRCMQRVLTVGSTNSLKKAFKPFQNMAILHHRLCRCRCWALRAAHTHNSVKMMGGFFSG